MAENMNTEREAFEAWAAKLGWADTGFAQHMAWSAWQARASLSLPAAGQEPVATQPTPDVAAKMQSNTWDHFGDILPTLKAISRGDWYWGANSRCKYIEIRLDTRDGGCLLYDRERVRISPEQFAHQGHTMKMEPWPAHNSLAAAPQPAVAAGWLNAKDMAALQRAEECFDDGEGHDLRKDQLNRLLEIGVMRHNGYGYYSITSFGRFILGDTHMRPPLETVDECNDRLGREHKQRIAALPPAPSTEGESNGK